MIKMNERWSPITFFNFIWDFILVWTFGVYFTLKQMIQIHRKPSGIKRIDGRVAIVTGGSKGIGLEIVRQFLSEGIHTIIAASSPDGTDLLKRLATEFPHGKVEYCQLDLTSMKSVRHFAERFLERNLTLNLLINNAGIMFAPYKLTEDGFESQLSTNYLGHFLLTYLLLPKLIATGTKDLKSRIINVSSCCHFSAFMRLDNLNSRKYYSAHGCYAQTKLAQVMHSILLQELLENKNVNVTVNAVHPGIIDTKLYQHTVFDDISILPKVFFKTPSQGADGIVHVALSEELEGVGGKYFENCQTIQPNKVATFRQLRLELWQETCNMLNIKDFEPSN